MAYVKPDLHPRNILMFQSIKHVEQIYVSYISLIQKPHDIHNLAEMYVNQSKW